MRPNSSGGLVLKYGDFATILLRGFCVEVIFALQCFIVSSKSKLFLINGTLICALYVHLLYV